MTIAPAEDLARLRVLVVDDEADIRLGLSRLAASVGAQVAEAENGAVALELIERNGADVVLTDLMMPCMSGAELLVEIKRRTPETEVVILTGYGTVQSAVQCLQSGAAHFLTKPFNNEEVTRLVERLGRQVLARRGVPETGPTAGARTLIAEDARMRTVLELVARVARTPVPVLIEGESGTGKELVARAVHEGSEVANKPFLAVNAAALPDTLLESELFGHERGAFTGADKSHEGLFVQAQGGTVFLDEVSSMSPSFQGKLLRVLQEKIVRPIGGTADRPVDFRLVSATNRDLEAQIGTGEFREDLFYRLGVVRVYVPPLRERPDDIAPLTRHFLQHAARVSLGPGVPMPRVSDEALRALEQHPWPGNVRELENAIQRAVIVCTGEAIEPWHLALNESGWRSDRSGKRGSDATLDYAAEKQRTLEKFQREFVHRALESASGNVSHAAEACGLTRAALQRIMRQLGIDRERFR
ncbi:MAG: sigma-54-dependent Fis family transcriptional regulator [Planctomycetota bacterium]|nr:MAG: sigma-54-dependent Fis family transcriptional regulator [Planctomycetota bacterium]